MELLYHRLTPDAFLERMRAAPIAYLPLGTLEYHGPHLPLGSDMLQPMGLYSSLAASVGGVVLPPVSMGPDESTMVDGKVLYGMDYEFLVSPEKPRQLPGSAYYVEGPVFVQYAAEMLKQLARAGIKIIVGHGHGPSTDYFRAHGKEWDSMFGVRTLTLQEVVPEKELGFMVDHAGANETSIMLATDPDLVRMGNLPRDPAEWPRGVMGVDPRLHASAEMGHRIIDANLMAMRSILKEELARV